MWSVCGRFCNTASVNDTSTGQISNFSCLNECWGHSKMSSFCHCDCRTSKLRQKPSLTFNGELKGLYLFIACYVLLNIYNLKEMLGVDQLISKTGTNKTLLFRMLIILFSLKAGFITKTNVLSVCWNYRFFRRYGELKIVVWSYVFKWDFEYSETHRIIKYLHNLSPSFYFRHILLIFILKLKGHLKCGIHLRMEAFLRNHSVSFKIIQVNGTSHNAVSAFQIWVHLLWILNGRILRE